MTDSSLPPPHYYPLGDTALVVAFGNQISEQLHARVRSLAAYLQRHPIEGVIEWVPAYTTLTLYYQPWAFSHSPRLPYQQLLEQVEGIVAQLGQEEPPAPRLVEIPVCYGGEYGPDLEAVARHTGLSPQELIRLHSGDSYRVYMLGFAPGFPYLGGMDKRLATPRKAEPRNTIPAGSVGIAGAQTGVYPLETPGGWQLIGRTPLRLFDAHREPPSLLQMGDAVRFVPIDEPSYQALERRQHGA